MLDNCGLADLGASAGLNLAADALPSIWSTDDGAPLTFGSPVGSSAQSAASALPPIVARWAFDLSPLHVDRSEDARWLVLAYQTIMRDYLSQRPCTRTRRATSSPAPARILACCGWMHRGSLRSGGGLQARTSRLLPVSS